MSDNNQIQEISELIDGAKVLIFKEVFKSVLQSKDAPFHEEVDHYFKELINSDITDPSRIGIVKLEKQAGNYLVSLVGPFKSYIEVNGVASQFDENGTITDLSVPIIIKTGFEDDDYLAIVSYAYSETKPDTYNVVKTPQEIIDEYDSHLFLFTNHSKTEANVGVLEHFNVPTEKLSVDVIWNKEKNRFEIVSHMKNPITFTLFGKQYEIKKDDVCKIVFDWNLVKNLTYLPFAEHNTNLIKFKNEKNQYIGQEDLSTNINLYNISNSNFLLDNSGVGQLYTTAEYDDNTGKLKVTTKDNYYLNNDHSYLMLKGLEPEITIFGERLTKESQGLYSKEFNLTDVKDMSLEYTFDNESTVPYDKSSRIQSIPTLTELFNKLNHLTGGYATSPDDMLTSINTPKSLGVAVFENGQKIFDLDRGLVNSKQIVDKFKAMVHPIMAPSIKYLFNTKSYYLNYTDSYFSQSLNTPSALSYLNGSYNWRDIDAEIAADEDYEYVKANMTKEKNEDNETFKLRLKNVGNKFNDNLPLVAITDDGHAYTMTKQPNGDYLSEDIGLVDELKPFSFSVSKEMYQAGIQLPFESQYGDHL